MLCFIRIDQNPAINSECINFHFLPTFRFRGRNCQSDSVFYHRKSNRPEIDKFPQKYFKRNLILLTFVGAEAAQFLAEHASITSFVAATVNQTTFFATIESLATAWAKILLLLFCCTVVPNCLNPPNIKFT